MSEAAQAGRAFLVLILTYGCRSDRDEPPVLSHEHAEVGFFSLPEVASLSMPTGYKDSIRSWFERLSGRDGTEP
ncbi:MAG: hypothetical protein J2P30_19790 [Actinobacteria bacterium]|nr:hypothetical protein [Actinomycetota bacterium]